MTGSKQTARTAYKFRPSDPFHRIVEIILNRKLYCAPYDTLNDPSEGHYFLTASDKEKHEIIAQKVKDKKQHLRVCSACSTYKNTLMWAHYAGGFDGVAIEVKIDGSFPVKYTSKLPSLSAKKNQNFASDGDQLAEVAKTILSHKLKVWKPEQELRVLQHDEFEDDVKFKDVAVKSVIVGPRVCAALVASLKATCSHASVTVKYAKISHGNISRSNEDPYHNGRRAT